MEKEKQFEDVRNAVAEFQAGLELTAEAHNRLQVTIASLPMSNTLREAYREIVTDDVSIAMCIYIMLGIAQGFSPKPAARQILIETAKTFQSFLSLNHMLNPAKPGECPLHGANCPEKSATSEEFPQHVDADLRPIEVPK